MNFCCLFIFLKKWNVFHCCIYQWLCFNIIPRKNKFFFFHLWSRVLDRTMPLYKECLKKSTTWLPLNLSHSCPTLSLRIMGRQILSSSLKKKKKSLEKTLKDKIHATNHSHAVFVTKEVMSSCSSLHPQHFMVQAKNFPPPSRPQEAFCRYSFDGALFMKACCDRMCVCERWSVISE